jgi:ATP-dependent Clp protease ATP-binding subunit ClpC
MFERFTTPARSVIVQSQTEARALKHSQIAPAHLLLGVMGQPEEPAAKVLASQAVDIDAVRQRVEETVTAGGEVPEPGAHIPFSSAAKRALELSLRQSLQLGLDYIGPEHLMLGILLCESDSDAVRVLADLRVDIEKLTQDLKSSRPGSA